MRLSLPALVLMACSAKTPITFEPIPDAGPLDASTVDAALIDGSSPPDSGGPGLDVATEACSHTFMVGPTSYSYAEHPYPGKLKADLQAVRAVGHNANMVAIPPAYADSQAIAHVRDGYAAVICITAAGESYDQVTFYF